MLREVQTLVDGARADELDFEATEVRLRSTVLQVAARALEQRFHADTSDHTGPEQPCPCGQTARYVDRRAKTFTSVLGDLTLQRAYYHCAACQQGFCPRDRALGMEGDAVSPGALRMIGSVAAEVSFDISSGLLWDLAGLRIDAKQVERIAERLGVEMADDERQFTTPHSGDALAPTLYLGIDGSGIPVRPEELVGRAGQQPNGKAKTREGKLVTVWSAESRDAEGLPVRDPGSITYSAAIESAAARDTDEYPSEFAERVRREATRRRFTEAQRMVVLADGASYNWNVAYELFPGATQILDRCHAKQHLNDVAKVIFGRGSAEGEPWASQRKQELDDERLEELLATLRQHADTCKEAKNCAGYVERNRPRMRYKEFHAAGLCTTSNIVESGCKVIFTTRFKHSAMHWSVLGANKMLAVRCYKRSGRFEDFFERRSQRRLAA
ncbi:MAG: ISKra4 family transposase [Terriglobales bacterium]